MSKPTESEDLLKSVNNMIDAVKEIRDGVDKLFQEMIALALKYEVKK